MAAVPTVFRFNAFPDIESSDLTLTSASYGNNSALTSVTVGNLVVSIGNNCFSGVTDLVQVDFDVEAIISSVGSSAFNDTRITSIQFPNTVTFIGQTCLAANPALTGCAFPNNVYFTAVPNTCCFQCSNLASVFLPTNIKSIGTQSFEQCTTLNNVTLPPALTLINQQAFASTGLDFITIPNSVTSIGTAAFSSCSDLTEVTFSDSAGITSFGASCFLSCTSLFSFRFTGAVSSVGNNVLRNCTSLQTVTWDDQNNLTSAGTSLFVNVPGPLTVNYYETASAAALNTASLTIYPSQYPGGAPATFNTFNFTTAPNCFAEGTTILCLVDGKDQQVPVEHLKEKETLVKTFLHGYRRIHTLKSSKMINDTKHFNTCLYTLRKSAANGLTADLTVTGGHGILVDKIDDPVIAEENRKEFKCTQPEIDGKLILLAGVSPEFEPVLQRGKVCRVFNFSLETDGDDDRRFGVFANGLLVETPSVNQLRNADRTRESKEMVRKMVSNRKTVSVH